jgi:hypothetical protein
MTTEKTPVLGLTVAALVLLSIFGIHRTLLNRASVGGDSVANVVNELPPAAAGLRSKLDGTKAVGQVTGIYVELGTNLYVSIERAPASLRKSATRYVNVEFPESLVKEFDTDSAIVKALDPAVEVGDVVEVKFVENSYAVGLNNVTRVTQIVAPHDTDMAKSFGQKLAAHKAAVKPVAMGDATPIPGAGTSHSTH